MLCYLIYLIHDAVTLLAAIYMFKRFFVNNSPHPEQIRTNSKYRQSEAR